MTQPFEFTRAVPQDELPKEDRDFLEWARTVNILLVVRPLEYQREGFNTAHKENSDVVWADVAILDPINEAYDLENNLHKGYPAGFQFRRQAVMPGYLKGTFKRYLGATLIGTTYRGVPTKGKPPIMWRDLSTDPSCVLRGQQFMVANPQFLIPVEITPTAPAQGGSQGYGNQGHQAAPAQAQPGYGGNGYGQPDPWAGQSAAAPASAPPAARPQTTLDQLRNMGQVNHQGQPQDPNMPF